MFLMLLSCAFQAASAKAPIVLVFDGLDQLAADNDGHYLTWLPMQFPPGVKVVCATVPNHLTADQVKRRGFQVCIHLSNISVSQSTIWAPFNSV